jgi:hypothetical protein
LQPRVAGTDALIPPPAFWGLDLETRGGSAAFTAIATGMKTGDRMSFTLMPDGVVLMRVKNKRVSGLAGLLHKKGRKPVSVELLSR